jgi:hypothetical protein
MSIPGIWSWPVGAGVLPDISIPDMSIPGIWSGAVGVAMVSNRTPEGTSTAVATPAAEASWGEVSMNDPATAIPATDRPTDVTLNGRHRKAAWVDREVDREVVGVVFTSGGAIPTTVARVTRILRRHFHEGSLKVPTEGVTQATKRRVLR